MNWIENVTIPKGFLEVVVTNHKTGELIRRDPGRNQIQDWFRHALSFESAGRPFCTWGNHGETVNDLGTPYSVPHLADGTTDSTVTESPWKYNNNFEGLIQVRSYAAGDEETGTAALNAPLYPFFPTKMRFGIGGLDADQNPRTDIPTSATKLQNVQESFPFVVIDRSRTTSGHITLEEGNLPVKHKVTYSVTLPGGGTDFAYDGYVLSEAGLFCDAALFVPPADTNMRTGTMMAYRTFYGITKNESIDVTFNWTFVF